jgi:hypothetical protein
VGCLGSGGNILIKPIVNGNSTTQLLKKRKAAPGSYSVTFENGIQAQMQVKQFLGYINICFHGWSYCI